jgi:hypothetical protein
VAGRGGGAARERSGSSAATLRRARASTTRQNALASGSFCGRGTRMSACCLPLRPALAPARLHHFFVAVGHDARRRRVGHVPPRGRVVVRHRPVGRKPQRQNQRARHHRRNEHAVQVPCHHFATCRVLSAAPQLRMLRTVPMRVQQVRAATQAADGRADLGASRLRRD